LNHLKGAATLSISPMSMNLPGTPEYMAAMPVSGSAVKLSTVTDTHPDVPRYRCPSFVLIAPEPTWVAGASPAPHITGVSVVSPSCCAASFVSVPTMSVVFTTSHSLSLDRPTPCISSSTQTWFWMWKSPKRSAVLQSV